MAISMNPTDRAKKGLDPVIPIAVIMVMALVFPAMHQQAWWLILAFWVCLIVNWPLMAFLALFAAISSVDNVFAGVYFLVLILILIMRLAGQHSSFSYWGALKKSTLMLAGSAGLMLLIMGVIFLVGGRWSDGQSSSKAGTGISDRIAPGSVTELVNITDIAMRIRFDRIEELPEQSELYWRGLVYEVFDGEGWSQRPFVRRDNSLQPAGDAINYHVALEGSNQYYLFGLHQVYTDRPRTFRNEQGMILSADVITQPIRYNAKSYLQPDTPKAISDFNRRLNLEVPISGNPLTRQWVEQMRQRYPQDKAFIQAVMQYFADEAFYYSFSPELLADHQIDQFLFTTREGFCEHYASALGYILRAAGIPARLVAGYQGGEINSISQHVTLYQYDAHAWVEAWVEGSGWVRLDPTAMIAPDRINVGFAAWFNALEADARSHVSTRTKIRMYLNQLPFISEFIYAFEALDYLGSVSAFDENGRLRTEAVYSWLEAQGGERLPEWILLCLLIYVILRSQYNAYKRRGQARVAPVLKRYMAFNNKLQKLGLQRQASETVAAHLQRLAQRLPAMADDFQQLNQLLESSLYGHAQVPQKEIDALVRHAYQSLKQSKKVQTQAHQGG